MPTDCWLTIECYRPTLSDGTSTEYAEVAVTGTLDTITDVMEQLAWITAVFRRPSPAQLTVSDIDFKAGISMDTDSKMVPGIPHFELSLYPPELSLCASPDAPGQCWAKLFCESILAYRFPTPKDNRPVNSRGLEIQFDIMTAAAGIRYPVSSGQRLILAGESVLLVPLARSGNTVQWHFLEGEGRFEKLAEIGERYPIPSDLVKSSDLSDWNALRLSHAFLGYYRQAGVFLGTKYAGPTDIAPTQVPEVEPVTAMDRRITVNAGFNHCGAIAGVTASVVIAQRERAVIPGIEINLDQRMARAKDNPIILFDDEADRAFMVSELCLALHMVHSSFRRRALDADIRARIPFAEVSADCGQSAYAAIKKSNRLTIPSDVDESCRPFSGFVDDYLTRFEQRKTQAAADRTRIKFKLSRDGLRGFGYDEMLGLQWEFAERGVAPKFLRSRPAWWKFTKKPSILVLFGRDLGCPIRSHPDCPAICNAWAEVPRDHGLLVTTIPVLRSLKNHLCTKRDGHKGRYMITNTVAWAKPRRSRLFQDCVEGGTCNPIQGLWKFSKRYPAQWWNESVYERNPGALEDEGSVIFSDNPSAFQARNCYLMLLPSPPKEYHALFFTFVGALFILCLALSGMLRIAQLSVYLERHLDLSNSIYRISARSYHDEI
jgi:hypothetical protein